jgi:hypothetical protein
MQAGVLNTLYPSPSASINGMISAGPRPERGSMIDA